MPRLSTALDPFAFPGRILNDSQTSCKPASRVLISDPDIVRAFGLNGRWNDVSRSVDYTEGVPEPGAMLDMETAMRSLINVVRRLDRERATLTMLMRSIMHGAIGEGLRVQTVRGSRQINMSGGVAIIVERDEATGGYAINRYTIPIINPLRFYIASGAALIDPGLHDTLPSVCAGEEAGDTVAWPAKTYRADLLALIPRGEDPTPEWYLFLGAPTQARSVDEIANIPTPPVPPEHAAYVLPMYRIVTRQGDKGIYSADQIANRVNGV